MAHSSRAIGIIYFKNATHLVFKKNQPYASRACNIMNHNCVLNEVQSSGVYMVWSLNCKNNFRSLEKPRSSRRAIYIYNNSYTIDDSRVLARFTHTTTAPESHTMRWWCFCGARMYNLCYGVVVVTIYIYYIQYTL